jgi:uncharacterized membrane protein YcaP (DUF421 family)
MPYLKILLSSVSVYLFIILFIRLFGKKELAQLSVIDLVFILLISNSVQNAMVGSDTSLTGGLVAAGSLFIVNYFFKLLLYKFPKFGKIVQGHAILLIYKGKFIESNLTKSKLTHSEVKEAIREHGVMNVGDVDIAVLEIDGNISILSNNFKQNTVKKIKRINKTEQRL